MTLNASDVYIGSLILLLLKYIAATVLQACERFVHRTFRYPEDASCCSAPHDEKRAPAGVAVVCWEAGAGHDPTVAR